MVALFLPMYKGNVMIYKKYILLQKVSTATTAMQLILDLTLINVVAK